MNFRVSQRTWVLFIQYASNCLRKDSDPWNLLLQESKTENCSYESSLPVD